MNNISTIPARPTILVFCRPYLVQIFRSMVEPLGAEYDFQHLTDGACSGTADTRQAFYAALDRHARSPELSADDEQEVIARCRMLRNIDPGMASRLVHAMAVTLAAELDRLRPAGVLSQMVDEYVTHLVWMLAEKRGIGYLGFCASYFSGRSLLLADAHGRPFDCREPQQGEVEAVLEKISAKSFRQDYRRSSDYNLPQHLYRLLRYQVKRLVFGIRSRLENDPWNLHYAVTPFMAERRRLGDYPYQSCFHSDWRERISRSRASSPDAPTVYLPLAYFPESTTDYWISNKRVLRYEALVLEMVRTLARDCIVVVKEHQHMMGARSGAFLRALRDVPGVISVHPKEFSNELVAMADAVLLGAGSAGIEATVHGRPVFSFCETSYWFQAAGATWLDLDRLDLWSRTIRTRLATFQPLDREGLCNLVRACLSFSARADTARTFWPILDPDDLRLILRKMTDRSALLARQA